MADLFISFIVNDKPLSSLAAITRYKPTLIIATWDGTRMTLWVDGVKATKTDDVPASISAVNGSLVIGGYQTGQAPTAASCPAFWAS